MKKIVIIIIIILSCLVPAAADTVLLCISDNSEIGENAEHSPWAAIVLRSFEDGVMDVFFEAGHIVTNSFMNECRKLSGEEVATSADIARIMGNRMGADNVMLLKLIFPETAGDTLPVPIKAEYALYTNSGKRVVGEKESVLSIAAERGEEELLDSFTEIGRSIASELALKL